MASYQCVQRVSLGNGVDNIIASCKRHPGAWDVACILGPIDITDAYDVRQRAIDRCREDVRRLHAAGLTVHINSGHVIGHGDYQTARPAPFPTMVGPHGEKCKVSLCPRSEPLHRRLIEVYRQLATLGAEAIWIDDDLRMFSHPPVEQGCFCDECIKKFNARFGRAYTRETLVAALLPDRFPEENKTRLEWLRFNHDALVGIVRTVSDAAHAVSPDVVMGVMLPGAEYNQYDLTDYRDLVAALENAKGESLTRPGYGFYSDRSPLGAVEKAITVARLIRHCDRPGAVHWAEEVTCPYTRLGKSDTVTAFEAALMVGVAGADGVMCEAIKDRLGEQDGGFIAALDRARPYLAALREALEGKTQIGLYPYFNPSQWAYSDASDRLGGLSDMGSRLSDRLFELGVPLTFDERGALALLLSGRSVKAMPNDALRAWLARGVYADGTSARLVQEKLGTDALGLYFLPPDPDSRYVDGRNERFTDHPLNGAHAGFVRGDYWGGNGDGGAKARATFAEPLSRSLVQAEAEAGIVGTTVCKTREGGRAAAFLRAPWTEDTLSLPKRDQILNVCEYLFGAPLPARVACEYKIGVSFWKGDSESVLTLYNIGFDDAFDVPIRLAERGRARVLRPDGTWAALGEGATITLPRLDAWTAAAIRIEACL